MTTTADTGDATATRSMEGILIAGWSAVLGTVLSFARAPLTGELDLPEASAPPETIIGFFEGLTFDAAFAAGMVIASVGWLLFLVFIAKIADLLYTVEVGYR